MKMALELRQMGFAAATCRQDFMNRLRSSSTKPRGGKQKGKMGLKV